MAKSEIVYILEYLLLDTRFLFYHPCVFVFKSLIELYIVTVNIQKSVKKHVFQTEYKYCYDLVLHYVLHYLDKDLKEKK